MDTLPRSRIQVLNYVDEQSHVSKLCMEDTRTKIRSLTFQYISDVCDSNLLGFSSDTIVTGPL